ncbi:hypothetical protein JNK13_07440 [bacterium]|nr:hypothetical protein [bacterium]
MKIENLSRKLVVALFGGEPPVDPVKFLVERAQSEEQRFTAWTVCAVVEAANHAKRPINMLSAREYVKSRNLALAFWLHAMGMIKLTEDRPELIRFWAVKNNQQDMEWGRHLATQINAAYQSSTPSWNHAGEIAAALSFLDRGDQDRTAGIVADYIDWLVETKAPYEMITLVIGYCYEEAFADVDPSRILHWANYSGQQWFKVLLLMVIPDEVAHTLAQRLIEQNEATNSEKPVVALARLFLEAVENDNSRQA